MEHEDNFDQILLYIRLRISAEILTNNQDFGFYFESAKEREEFCRKEVEAIDAEADQLQIVALQKFLGVPFVIYQQELGVKHVNVVRIPEGVEGEDTLEFLLQPGHYNIIY